MTQTKHTQPVGDVDELREYIYATYYGLVIQEVWAKGGRELTSSERTFCDEITDKLMDKIATHTTALLDRLEKETVVALSPKGQFIPWEALKSERALIEKRISSNEQR